MSTVRWVFNGHSMGRYMLPIRATFWYSRIIIAIFWRIPLRTNFNFRKGPPGYGNPPHSSVEQRLCGAHLIKSAFPLELDLPFSDMRWCFWCIRRLIPLHPTMKISHMTRSQIASNPSHLTLALPDQLAHRLECVAQPCRHQIWLIYLARRRQECYLQEDRCALICSEFALDGLRYSSTMCSDAALPFDGDCSGMVLPCIDLGPQDANNRKEHRRL